MLKPSRHRGVSKQRLPGETPSSASLFERLPKRLRAQHPRDINYMADEQDWSNVTGVVSSGARHPREEACWDTMVAQPHGLHEIHKASMTYASPNARSQPDRYIATRNTRSTWTTTCRARPPIGGSIYPAIGPSVSAARGRAATRSLCNRSPTTSSTTPSGRPKYPCILENCSIKRPERFR